MSKRATPINYQRFTLEMAGSNKFGRYPKISAQSTFNMFISDKWLVPTPGHLRVATIETAAEGRGIYTSSRGGFMLAVIDEKVYKIDSEIKQYGRTIDVDDPSEQAWEIIGNINTFEGDVFIDENQSEEIAICDKKDIYIYNYNTGVFQKADLGTATDAFTPGYVIYHDGYFIAPDTEKPHWRLSDINNGLSWPATAQRVGEFETKTDNPLACIRVPGKGNQIFVIGSIVTEVWNDMGYALFPYYRTNSFNIDYGCVNQATIASSDRFVIWLAANEQSSPVIMVSDGGNVKQVSTDGINFALSQLTKPEDSYGFIYKNDGHLFYQLTFNTDNVSYLYDFNTDKFFFVTDENMGNHIAKRVTFFENDYYFISLVDGNLYRLSGNLTTYDGNLIPRVRVANTIRYPDASPFIGKEMGFTLEQGDATDNPAVDISVSYDGGVSFGNSIREELNSLGNRQNRFRKYDLGYANEFTPQFRFWGNGRFVCTDGYVEVYK